MNVYVTAKTIKKLREERHMTQTGLAELIGVSDKAISKWETARGLPDISLIEPLAKALGVSVIELISGEYRINQNISCNVKRSKIYVCPVCGNIIHATGAAVVSCCGITLPELEPEQADEEHFMEVVDTDARHDVRMEHPMTKDHYISWMAYVTDGRFEMKKLYPEGSAEADFLGRGHGLIFSYCNRHGLFVRKV